MANLLEYFIGQEGREGRSTLGATTRAESPLLAARRHQKFIATICASDASKATLETATVKIGVNDTVDPLTGLMDAGDSWAWRMVHATFSTLAVIGYVVQLVTGRKLMRGARSALAAHKVTAKVFLATRVLAYVTMYLV